MLACFAESDDKASRGALEKICSLHLTLKPTRITLAAAFMSLFRSTPFLVARFQDRRHLQTVLEIVRGGIDLVQIEGIHAAYYGIEIKGHFSVPVILRHHNLASVNLASYVQHHPNVFARLFLRLEVFKLRRYERFISGFFDRFLMLTREDETILHELAPAAPTCVIPAGVDTKSFTPAVIEEESDSILWIGSLQWLPNQDSFFWFYNVVFPLILSERPSAVLSVAGSNPPQAILRLNYPNLRILGFVDDVRPVMHRASVCVVPLRAGSGIRIKLLEMFAMRKAVVSTTLGCEGLDVRDDVHLKIADSAEEFAQAVVTLLKNPGKRSALGMAALNHVRENFTWDAVVDQYEQVYRELVPTQQGAPNRV
jgi:glycosyltransferase involved in cell wall biosynthesis